MLNGYTYNGNETRLLFAIHTQLLLAQVRQLIRLFMGREHEVSHQNKTIQK